MADINLKIINGPSYRLTAKTEDAYQLVFTQGSKFTMVAGSGQGKSGRAPEFRSNGTDLQWRYVGDTDWNDLVALADITGLQGESIQLQVSGGYIQMKYPSDTEWTNLIALSALKGADGVSATVTIGTVEEGATPRVENIGTARDAVLNFVLKSGKDGNDGDDGKSVEVQNNGSYVQWRKVGDPDWINLIALTAITGNDGKSVELQISSGYIQWRQIGGSWTNLIAVADITGADGYTPRKGVDYFDGDDGHSPVVEFGAGEDADRLKIDGVASGPHLTGQPGTVNYNRVITYAMAFRR